MVNTKLIKIQIKLAISKFKKEIKEYLTIKGILLFIPLLIVLLLNLLFLLLINIHNFIGKIITAINDFLVDVGNNIDTIAKS